MNILLFSAIYPAPDKFGLPKDTQVVLYYAKDWIKQGHNVRVINLHLIPVNSLKKGIHINKLIPSKLQCYEYEGIKTVLIEVQLLVPHANSCLKFQGRCVGKLISEYLKEVSGEFTPDIAFMHFPMSFRNIDIKMNPNLKISGIFHNSDIKEIEKNGIENCRKYICGFSATGSRNKKIAKFLNKRYYITSPLIYSGVSEDLIPDKEFILAKLEKNIENLNIVYAGNLIKIKNVDTLIRAVSGLDFPYKLKIAGDGPELENLISLTKSLSCEEHIEFKGRLSRDETILLMREADIFVMVSSPETFGLVYIEAMAQGCIAIGSRGEGIDGVIKDGENGYLVQQGNADALRSALINVSKLDKKEKTHIIINSFETACDMTDENMAKKYITYFTE